ncbi:MAG TPA: hypothetical protein VGC41_16485 [Kofleriaceae bacterium]
MRILAAAIFVTTVVIACGAPPKPESAIVKEGSDQAPTCCCKTIPVTDDKEITPQYAMGPRMECSTNNGECVDEVQCNGASPTQGPNNGNPPPPAPITPSSANDL